MPLPGQAVEQTVRAAVTIVRRNQEVARFEQLYDEVERCHAGRSDDGTYATFQFRQGLRKGVSETLDVARAAIPDALEMIRGWRTHPVE